MLPACTPTNAAASPTNIGFDALKASSPSFGPRGRPQNCDGPLLQPARSRFFRISSWLPPERRWSRGSVSCSLYASRSGCTPRRGAFPGSILEFVNNSSIVHLALRRIKEKPTGNGLLSLEESDVPSETFSTRPPDFATQDRFALAVNPHINLINPI